MSGFLILLAVGAVTWYAWPAAPTFPTKVWTVVFATFLMPVSWPWLIARGYRARQDAEQAKAHEQAEARQRERTEQTLWWLNEFDDALRNSDLLRAQNAWHVLNGWGCQHPEYWACSARLNRLVRETSK